MTIHTVEDIDKYDAKYQAQVGNGFSRTRNMQNLKQDTMNISAHGLRSGTAAARASMRSW